MTKLFLLLLSLTTTSHAAAPALQSGDLIFQTSLSSQADAIMMATGSPYSHVGVIEVAGAQAFVVEAISKVSRTPLAGWIARGRGGKYAVYRYRGLSGAQGREVVNAAKSYLGQSYDPFFTFTNEEIYCSELVWLAYKSAGLKVGSVQAIRELRVDGAAVERLIKNRWRRHPLCAELGTYQECWGKILADTLVTPVSLSEDSRMEQVFTNFR